MEIRNYDLLDVSLLELSPPAYRCLIWRPDFTCLILGQSNKAETSLLREAVEQDAVSVYKRPSGGETVLLSPKTLVISILIPTADFKAPRACFNHINGKIASSLQSMGISDIRLNGISDICIGEKKILGSSIYRSRDRMLYHAVLNVSEDTALIGRYLKHPSREPEYRRGRAHEDFVTSLAREGFNGKMEALMETLTAGLQDP